MNNFKKALRTGGKGSPRSPPKRVSNKSEEVLARLDQVVHTHRKTCSTVDVSVAMLIQEDGATTYKKPDVKAFMAGKNNPIAYLIKGKGDYISTLPKKEEDIPDDFEKAVNELMKKSDGEDLNVHGLEEDGSKGESRGVGECFDLHEDEDPTSREELPASGEENSMPQVVEEIESKECIKNKIKEKFDEEWTEKGSNGCKVLDEKEKIEERLRKDNNKK